MRFVWEKKMKSFHTVIKTLTTREFISKKICLTKNFEIISHCN